MTEFQSLHLGWGGVAANAALIVTVLKRCGVEEFIASSTTPQAECVEVGELLREAKEMRRWGGEKVHQFLFVTEKMYKAGSVLPLLDSGLFEGLKFHECNTHWNLEFPEVLDGLLSEAAARRLKVMFHCGNSDGCRPSELEKWARRYPKVKFNFAHCCPCDETIQVMRRCPNVHTDVSFQPSAVFAAALKTDVADRVMWGSDMPVQVIAHGGMLTPGYRRIVKIAKSVIGYERTNRAFENFLLKS